MVRFVLIAAIVSLVYARAAHAADVSMCTSLCAQQKKECKANVPMRVDLDRSTLVAPEEKNPFARNATRGAVVGLDERQRERSDVARHTSERNGMCDDTYARCIRGCAAPGTVPGTSEVLTPQGKARPGKS